MHIVNNVNAIVSLTSHLSGASFDEELTVLVSPGEVSPSPPQTQSPRGSRTWEKNPTKQLIQVQQFLNWMAKCPFLTQHRKSWSDFSQMSVSSQEQLKLIDKLSITCLIIQWVEAKEHVLKSFIHLTFSFGS